MIASIFEHAVIGLVLSKEFYNQRVLKETEKVVLTKM